MASLPVGHPGRPAAAWALSATVAVAVAFTAFAVVTSQAKGIRAGSPWQDDPYDGVVSFTVFLVPTLALLIVARAALNRRSAPAPVFRAEQLLRAALVCITLVAATVITDWLALALRADRPLWNAGTPWLVAALALVTVAVGAAVLLVLRARRRLPERKRSGPDGDWLDDLPVLIARLPTPVRRAAGWSGRDSVTRFAREHIVAIAATASLASSLLDTTAQAVGEGWSSPLLFFTGVAVGAGGFFAFSMASNVVLQIAVPRGGVRGAGQFTGPCPVAGAAPIADPRLVASPARRAARVAVVVGSLALPVAAVLRDSIWATLGWAGEVDSPEWFAAITFGGAFLAAAVTFVVVLLARPARPRPLGRRDGGEADLHDPEDLPGKEEPR